VGSNGLIEANAGGIGATTWHHCPMDARFGRVLTAMVTPFHADGSLDLDGAQALAHHLTTDGGNDGLVIAGTTGESPTLTHDEQIDLVKAVVEATDKPVVAGAGSNDTLAAVELTKRVTAAGAHGVLHVAGYYNRPSQAGLSEHFRACAAATDLPIVLYDIPVRTGRKIATETMVDLFTDVENIIGVKDAAGSPAETARLLSIAPEGTEVYSGDDGLTLPLLAVGAVGVIGVATHWIGNETTDMVSAFFGGDVRAAAEINRRLIPSYEFETGDLAPNPIPTKAMLRVLGLPGGPTRMPMGPEPAFVENDAKSVLADLGRA
jgi:4-hydroxy-tetrahydrodipicolinate synthase